MRFLHQSVPSPSPYVKHRLRQRVCQRSIPCLSSKKNDENTDQAMAINDARSSGEEQGGPAMENIGDTPMVETLQPHRLPVPW